MNIIDLKKINKVYSMGDMEVHALRGVDLKIESGEFISIMGASGSGKSTLMNIIGCLDYPSGGVYNLDGLYVNKMSRRQLADIRNQKVGFVFQGFNLLARTTAVENVELPLLYDRRDKYKEPRKIAEEALNRVGLEDRIYHESNQLSGGEQQRVAIARALVNEPSILLADEPTGNLDSKTSIDVMSLFQELNNEGITILLVTHEPDLAQYSKRIVVLRDGFKVKDEVIKNRRIAVNDLKTYVNHMAIYNGKFEKEVSV
jgi:putative ABC transport system ATP-binding protein